MNLREVEFATIKAGSYVKINEDEITFCLNKAEDTANFVKTVRNLFEDNCEEIKDLTIDMDSVTEWQAYLLENVDDCWSQSPYSDSFYNSDDIDWNYKPRNSLRVSDHWNFWSRGEKHCCLEYNPEIKQQWLVAKYTTTGYEVVQKLSNEVVDFDWSNNTKCFQTSLSIQACDYDEDNELDIDDEITLTAEQQRFVTNEFLQKDTVLMNAEPSWFNDKVRRYGLNNELLQIAESQNCDMFYLTKAFLKNEDYTRIFECCDEIELENGDLIITGANLVDDQREFERPEAEKFTYGEKAEKAETVAEQSSSFEDWEEGMESLESWSSRF